MCGIVGIVGSDIDYKFKKVFKDLLKIDTIRGVDSTGVLTVAPDGSASTFKKAIDGFSFTDLGKYNKYMDKTASPKLLLGHNRAATAGAVNHSNAHPFTDGDTHLVHNGTLKSFTNLHNHMETFVDSEAICFEVEKTSIEEAVEKLNGAFTIGTYDEAAHVFSLIRNEERPMHIAKVKGKDITIFASEAAFITAVAERNNIELSSKPWCLKEQVLVNFDLTKSKDIHEFDVNDDVKFYTPPVYSGGNYRKKHHTSTRMTGRSTTSTMASINANLTPVQKRQQATRLFLQEQGISIGDNIICSVDNFSPFKGQEEMGDEATGTMGLSFMNPDSPYTSEEAVSYQCDLAAFNRCKMKYVHCVVLGKSSRPGNKSTDLILVKVTGVLTSYEEECFWSLFDWGSDTDSPKQTDYYVDSTPSTKEEFIDSVKDGCGVCGDPIPLSDSGKIVWGLGSPLCKECSTDLAHKSKETQLSLDELLLH